MSSDALCLSSEDTKRVRGILTVSLPNAENSPPTMRFKKKKKKNAQAGLTRLKSIFGSPLDDASRGEEYQLKERDHLKQMKENAFPYF